MTKSQCFSCVRYWGVGKCDAYPKRIPSKIFLDKHDHTKPYKGDNGIRFEPIKDKRDS